MKISLNRISLVNFKGIRSLDVNFGKATNISGENATGKTTIFDAFLWLLFGKDSTDRKDFEIKTLGPDNQPYHRMDHEVTAYLNIDGEDIVLKRVFKENWVTQRGESQPVFKGHVTGYFWNDVPMKLEEYQGKINGILNENVFKLITNTGYFNSLKWTERRNVLLQIGGEISNIDILDKIATIQNKTEIGAITAALNQKKTLDQYKAELSSKRKKIKDELELIPARIDEATRSLPEEDDYDAVQDAIIKSQGSLETVDSLLINKSKAQKERQLVITTKLNEVQAHRSRKQQIEFDIKNSVRDNKQAREQAILDKKRSHRDLQDNLSRNGSDQAIELRKKTAVQAEQAELRAKWKGINDEKLEFKEGEFHCPACKREYEATNIETKKEELTKNFNSNKSKRLTEITERGKSLTAQLAAVDSKLTQLIDEAKLIATETAEVIKEIALLEEDHASKLTNETLEVTRSIATNKEYQDLTHRIEALQDEVNAPDNAENNSELLGRKKELVIEIDTLKNRLSKKDQKEKIKQRISQLETQEREIAGELGTLEGIEYTIEQFTKAKMDMLVSLVNGRFKIVQFKLFEEQINGGLEPCCEALINGVPFSDANTASRINAGLDIINTLCQHYDAYAPIFVDNAESVNTLVPVNSQIIRLVVSKDKKLKIESRKDALAEVA